MAVNNVTLLENLINPQVMADMIAYELENKLQATRFFKIDRTLTGRAGDTITVPSYLYIGEAAELPENEQGEVAELHTEDISYTVKKAVKNVILTDEAVLSAHGDPVGETNRQLAISIYDKMENDAIKLLKSIAPGNGYLTLARPTEAINYDMIVDAIDLLRLEEEETLFIMIGESAKNTIRKDPRFVDRHTAVGDRMILSGSIGSIAGAEVVISNRIDELGATTKAFVFKNDIFTAFMKRDITLETQRELLYKRTIIGSDAHYVIAIEDYKEVVSITHAKNA